MLFNRDPTQNISCLRIRRLTVNTMPHKRQMNPVDLSVSGIQGDLREVLNSLIFPQAFLIFFFFFTLYILLLFQLRGSAISYMLELTATELRSNGVFLLSVKGR